MYVTLKLDDSGWGPEGPYGTPLRSATPGPAGPCRIHSVSDGNENEQIVTNERYVVMPWKMVTRHGTNMTLKEAVDRILNKKESENKELEIRKRERARRN